MIEQKRLLQYGNELQIIGFVVGNNNEHELIYLSDMVDINIQPADINILVPSFEELHQIIRQLDVQEIEGLQKVILRKSQRNIDQSISWQVFRRDGYKCVYCGANDVPLTVDHIVLWEHMGDTHPDNLNSCCKKCNKTRGSMDYDEWIDGYVRAKVEEHFDGSIEYIDYLNSLALRGVKARKLPLRNTKRSR